MKPQKLFSKPQPPCFSLHEVKIIQLYAQGKTYNEIGNTLFISEDTVRTHLQNARNKCDLKMRVIIYYFTKGGVI